MAWHDPPGIWSCGGARNDGVLAHYVLRSGTPDAGGEGHPTRSGAVAALPARERGRRPESAVFAPVNASLTEQNSKNLNCASKTLKTKVVDGT